MLTLFVLDFGLDVVNSVAGLHLQGDGLASEGLDKDLKQQSKRQSLAVYSRQAAGKPQVSASQRFRFTQQLECNCAEPEA